ncbi:hypothetical protein GCM10025868_07130 [Angustibacter aerolatus]|uniref:Response regulatory domain-containing protein n=1 Tax=Angustibacter aerolatus TaxID=1162965 RepID=A0ABQ6JBB5_9ACTN|nr:response regulator transcription factor [Angustibacter aerolatus]GMA85463.1 hypothetical protein GCM10025868_07130 [Angustibacter aerolatus]
MQVLLVEDDDRGAAALGDLLSRHGFVVTRAGGVAQALERFGPRTEVVLVDLGLPDGDGFDLCTRLRAVRDVPILITTARSGVRARVHGLHLGADDYLVKPFDVRELMARIHAVVRRTRVAEPAADVPDRLRVGDVEIDFAQRVVRSAGREVALTPKEPRGARGAGRRPRARGAARAAAVGGVADGGRRPAHARRARGVDPVEDGGAAPDRDGARGRVPARAGVGVGSRLQAVLVSLMAVVLLALGIPLGAGQARSVTQAAFVDRLNDTSRFASLAGDDDGLAAATAQDVGAAPPALAPRLRRYAEVYAVGVALVSRSGEVRAGAGGAEDVAVSAQPDVRARLQAALAGRRSEPPAAVLPWSDAPLVVAEPVVTGGDVVGAVLTVSPTSGVRRAVLRSWVVLGLAGSPPCWPACCWRLA